MGNYWNKEDIKENKDNIRKVFFYRICGSGMGAAACLLKEMGLEVIGCDNAFHPPMSDYLKQLSVDLYDIKKMPSSVWEDVDLVVVGNCVAAKSEDARYIENLEIPYASFPAVLGGLLLSEKKVIGVAGTHGKTTTTYLMMQLLEGLGRKPGYLIGGVVQGREPASLGKDNLFIIESDEYDSAYFEKVPKFNSYCIEDLIVTSLEFDHADIYESLESIEKQFRYLIEKIGVKSVISNQAYPATQRVLSNYQGSSILYGLEGDPGIIEVDDQGTRFEFSYNKERYSFQTNLIGKHNILNLTACLKYLMYLGYPYHELKQTCRDMKMVMRRQQVRGLYQGAFVIDDFAHHPKAVDLTLSALRQKYRDKKCFVVFEPISATARSSVFQKDFAQSLRHAHRVIIADAKLPTTAIGHTDLNVKLLIDDLKLLGVQADQVSDLKTLQELLGQEVDSSCVLIILSNRTCLGLWDCSFVDEIQ